MAGDVSISLSGKALTVASRRTESLLVIRSQINAEDGIKCASQPLAGTEAAERDAVTGRGFSILIASTLIASTRQRSVRNVVRARDMRHQFSQPIAVVPVVIEHLRPFCFCGCGQGDEITAVVPKTVSDE